MKTEKDYIGDIAEIRSMMERTSKFLSLSGWAGIMAGSYALAGAYIAYALLDFNPSELSAAPTLANGSPTTVKLLGLALITLILAVGTAILLSYRKANKRGERLWNATSRRMVIDLAVPLVVGGLLILVLLANGLIGLVAPFSLIFYGLALYGAGNSTYRAVKVLGLMEIVLGLVATCFISYGLLCWAIGFGLLHLIYGIYIHYSYEK